MYSPGRSSGSTRTKQAIRLGFDSLALADRKILVLRGQGDASGVQGSRGEGVSLGGRDDIDFVSQGFELADMVTRLLVRVCFHYVIVTTKVGKPPVRISQ